MNSIEYSSLSFISLEIKYLEISKSRGLRLYDFSNNI